MAQLIHTQSIEEDIFMYRSLAAILKIIKWGVNAQTKNKGRHASRDCLATYNFTVIICTSSNLI